MSRNDPMTPAFRFSTVRKVVGWGFGQSGWRICRICEIKQQVTLDQVTEWLMNKSTPPCGRCRNPTDLVRDEDPGVKNYLVVAATVARANQK